MKSLEPADGDSGIAIRWDIVADADGGDAKIEQGSLLAIEGPKCFVATAGWERDRSQIGSAGGVVALRRQLQDGWSEDSSGCFAPASLKGSCRAQPYTSALSRGLEERKGEGRKEREREVGRERLLDEDAGGQLGPIKRMHIEAFDIKTDWGSLIGS